MEQSTRLDAYATGTRPGQPTPYKTEVRILTSNDALYFGIVCHDPKPQAIAIHTQRRDGDQSGDDSVAVVLDTYGDRRTGYFFQINAAGARVDGLIDARQINLTRFPLFFPEKRTFFLEGANQYTFGLGLGQQFIPFVSRNIGLLDGVQIPLNGGVKLNDRASQRGSPPSNAITCRMSSVPVIAPRVHQAAFRTGDAYGQ
jgi:hypothetical protein